MCNEPLVLSVFLHDHDAVGPGAAGPAGCARNLDQRPALIRDRAAAVPLDRSTIEVRSVASADKA
jgi:hypothetical protein